jgi:DNA-binding transcriptional regulator YiaG
MDRLNARGLVVLRRLNAPGAARRLQIEPQRFRRVRQAARLTAEACAKLLRVTRRTITNWEAGRARIPYSALRLLRIESGQQIPGAAWKGWYVNGDYICSPVGHRFCRAELLWLSLTFRRAEAFSVLYAKVDGCAARDPMGGNAAGYPQSPRPEAAPRTRSIASEERGPRSGGGGPLGVTGRAADRTGAERVALAPEGRAPRLVIRGEEFRDVPEQVADRRGQFFGVTQQEGTDA